MGENEQGGMLRNVVVIGLVAMIAAVIIVAVVGLKSNMTKNTDSAVGAVVRTKVPYSVENPDVTYEKYTSDDTSSSYYWGKHITPFPLVGDIPNNSWREDRLVINSSARIYINADINDYYETMPANSDNDNDDVSKRLFELYDENGTKLTSITLPNLYPRVYLDKDKDYTLIVKYFNNSGQTLVERAGDDPQYWRSNLGTGTDDGSPYRLKIKSFEAATYDDKYNK